MQKFFLVRCGHFVFTIRKAGRFDNKTPLFYD